MKKRPVIIIGGGPAGCATALYLLRAGVRPLIIERDTFPRFHIGESLSGECGADLRGLGLEDEILRKKYPIKHGVKVYNPHGTSFWVEVKKRCPETNALIPTWTWSVVRSSFDRLLLDVALNRAVEYMDREAVAPIKENGRITGVQIRTATGKLENLHCDVLVDCSGQATFLANRGITGKKIKGSYTNQVAVFSQLTNMLVDAGGPDTSQAPGNSLIFYKVKDHWAWMIPLSDTITSIGVVVPAPCFKERKLDKVDFLRDEILTLNPDLTRRVTNTSFVEEVRTISSYSYTVPGFTGPGFVCVGDSHHFTDPIFSFGVFLSMKEGEFAAEAILKHLSEEKGANENPFIAYEAVATQGQDAVRDLIDCFWEYPLVFTRMAAGKAQDDITDLFAGRLYGEAVENNVSRIAMRRLMEARRAEQPKVTEPALSSS
jgi:flavin-dependent dehydrogenase